MRAAVQGRDPLWRAAEGRALRPEVWMVAIAVVAMLLVEVWQSARMAEVAMTLDQSRKQLVQERSRLEFDRAEVERGLTRAELVPVADRLGLSPVEGSRQIELPVAYLARDSEASEAAAATRVAWMQRAWRAVVPDAFARSRTSP
jgi:hypothetical protein